MLKCLYLLPTVLAWEVIQSPPSVRPSVRPFVSSLTFKPSYLWPWPFACVWVMIVALMGLKVKVRGQA